MEYLVGGSLRDRLAGRDQPMTSEEVVRFALDVAAALKAAADQQLLHRNINPSCILFAADDTAKLGDFVLMRGEVVDSIQQITQAGSPPGEHVYQPPELVEGQTALTPACDIYSLAAAMYEALTLQPPFAKEHTLPEVIESILKRLVTSPRKLNPAVSPALEQLVLRGLAKDPHQRFTSAAEFGEALRQVCS